MPVHTLMFGWEFPPLHSGGLGVACEGLVHGLLENGTAVTLVLPSGTSGEGQGCIIQRIGSSYTMLQVPCALKAYDDIETYGARPTGNAPLPLDNLYGPDLGTAVEQFALLSVAATREVHPDIVHCHDWMTFEAGLRAATDHDVPCVTHIHATELDRTDFHPNPWIFERERSGMVRADRIISVSCYTKNLLTKHYGIPEGKITVVHNGHRLSSHPHRDIQHIWWGAKPDHPTVLFLGRLTVQKNPWQFLQVAKRIQQLRPDVCFIVAGSGPMLGYLMEEACALGLQECTLFTGQVSRAEADVLFQQASCFVMPSLSEPFGLVALEAIAHGVPVVLSRQSGASEVIDHSFKVDFWDTEKMADCILTILREFPLAEQLRSEAPRILQKLTWTNQARIVTSIYRDLLQSKL